MPHVINAIRKMLDTSIQDVSGEHYIVNKKEIDNLVELASNTLFELPTDKDGVPIHIDDIVQGIYPDEAPFTGIVEAIEFIQETTDAKPTWHITIGNEEDSDRFSMNSCCHIPYEGTLLDYRREQRAIKLEQLCKDMFTQLAFEGNEGGFVTRMQYLNLL